MKHLKVVVVSLFLISAMACLNPAYSGDNKKEIIVSAAASLTNAMSQVGQAFEAANPDIKVVFNFASSGSLLQQMIHGAPVDVFASANQKFMNRAQEEKLILTDTRKNFVSNKLVLAAPADSSLDVKVMEDLKKAEVKRISLGSPESVPAGRYARESLKGYGLWDSLAGKFIYGNSVRQVLDYLIRGEVDMGLVYSTDAKIGGDKVKVVTEAGKHKPIIYPIAAIAGTKEKESAVKFIDFVLNKAGQSIFAEFGFAKP